MFRTRSHHLCSMLFYAVGLFAFFSFVGCTKNATPIVEPTKLTGMLPTLLEVQKSTSTPKTRMTESTPHVSPYIKVMVVDVEIRFLETDPVQVELVISGTLPDQCKYVFYSVENRVDNNIKVSLDGIHPPETGCSQTDQTIEYVMLLGRDMPEADRGFLPGDYNLTVNNYKTSFSIK